MSKSNENNTGRTIAIFSGGAFLLWLLWPGGGKGKGEGRDSDRIITPAAVVVGIRSGDKVELDGASSDLATTVARAHAAGAAHVFAAGDARQGWVTTVIDALKAAGVTVYTRIDDTSGALVPRNARTSHIVGRGVPVKAHERRWPRHGG